VGERTPGAYGAPPPGASGHGRPGGSGRSGGKRRTSTFIAGAVGALVVIAAAFYVTGTEGDKKEDEARKSPSPTATASVDLPPGVKCSGDSCAGKDAEAMGCSGDLVTTTRTATVGATTVEVRYSETCAAAWGRITQGAQGDEVEISAGTAKKQSDGITAAGDTVAYTPMMPVENATDAKACVVLAATGEKGCTE
jgi:hypothetical protein